MTRGDTFAARLFVELSEDSQPMEVTSARMQVRTPIKRRLLLEWKTDDNSLTITGAGSNEINLGEKSDELMAALPAGDHVYDLEVTLADGTVLTVLAGKFPMREGVTQ